MPKLKENIKKISFKQGLYLGILLSIINIGIYLYANFSNNWSLMISQWYQFAKFLIIVGFASYTTILCRKAYMNSFSFRDGFSAFFIAVAVGLGIYVLGNWFLLSVFDADAGEIITKESVVLLEERLGKMEQAPEKIEESIQELYENPPFAFKNQFIGYIFNLVLYCLPAIIIALLFKTKKPIIR